MPASPPATRWSAWPTCHSSLEPAGHGQSSAPLGPTPLLLQPLMLHALVPQLPFQHLSLWASSPVCLLTHLLPPPLWASGPFWPSFTSGTHLCVPQSPAFSGPHVSGFLCLRVPLAQGLLAAQPLLSPCSPSLGLPPLQGWLSPGPSQAAPFLSVSRPFLGPILSLWGGAEDPRGAALPSRTDADPAAPWRGVGAPVFRDGWHATPAWPRGPAGPADTLAAGRGWLWSACT